MSLLRRRLGALTLELGARRQHQCRDLGAARLLVEVFPAL